MDLTNLSKLELLKKCQELGYIKCKSKNKDELIDLINIKTQQLESSIAHDKNIDKKDILKNEINTSSSADGILILNADCMIELNKLEDNSIDCVITDPPYFIDKLDSKWSSSQVNNDVKNSHIRHLPKGMKFDKSQVKNLYDYNLE
jgi:hypothetical protein